MITESTHREMDEALARVVEKTISGIGLKNQELSQDLIDSLYSYAYHFYQNGKYSEAKSFFRFLTLLNKDLPKYWMGLGACDQMLKNYAEAIYSYNVAMVLNERDPYVYFVIADCYIADGHTEKGIEVLEEAVLLFGDDDKYKKIIAHIDVVRQAWDNQQLENSDG